MKKKNNKNLQRINERLKSIEIDERFRLKVAEIRKELGIPPCGCKTCEEVNKSILDASVEGGNLIVSISNQKKSLKCIDWIESMLRDFDISDFYKDFIESYVYYNDFYVNSIHEEVIKKGVKVKFYLVPEKERFYIDENELIQDMSKIIIEVGAETTIKDIQAIWPEIKLMQKRLVGFKAGRHKFASLRNMDINRRIYDLHLQKQKNSEIAKMIKKEFELKKPFTYSDVGKRLQEFKKNLMKNKESL